ncbi:unnamed protein product [Allacma fusca]|uniref:Uncharacterized protein n=1 Tax=Allacma fusca TaxID=39272 RepID=A0A8J2LP90_9HEXA|nr:unnamed protein product [Allacma fusca]
MPPKRPLSGESFVRPEAIADAKRRASPRERKRRSRQRMEEEKAGRKCTKCHRYARKHKVVPPVDVVSNIVADSHQDEEDEEEDVRSDGSVGFRSRESSRCSSVEGGGERSYHPHHRSREGSADSLEDFKVVA